MIKIPKLEKLKIVEITWWDTLSYDNWERIEDIFRQLKDDDGKELIKTTGYFMGATKKTVLISCAAHFDTMGDLSKVGASWFIPIGCIKSIKKI